MHHRETITSDMKSSITWCGTYYHNKLCHFRIYELRLMMDFNGNNRGFAFVKYCAQADAKRALKELNNMEIRKGRLLGVCKSVDNCR